MNDEGGKKRKDNKTYSKLSLTLKPELIPGFFTFLQKGLAIKARVGSSIKAFLCDQLGLSEDYIDQRIQTFFLDGKTVDDVNSATVRDGSTLALSAALPGLVGAILRKDSYYKEMRSQISYKEEAESISAREGTVFLKLFNLLTREVGPSLLKQGVWIQGKDLQDFFRSQPERFWAGCGKAMLDGEEIDLKKLLEREWPEDDVFMKLEES
ncbi:MAG: hypothetical protein PVG99_01445 [Desulfobacteraceae bacterium]|jgi:hypothetical protein